MKDESRSWLMCHNGIFLMASSEGACDWFIFAHSVIVPNDKNKRVCHSRRGNLE